MNTVHPFAPRLPSPCAARVQLAGCDAINACLHPTPDIKFAPAGKGYARSPISPCVEHDFPLTMDELQKLTPDNLKNFSQEQLDQIYARLTAGPIPDGAFDGDLVFPKGESGDRRLAEIVGGLPGLAVELKLHRVEDLGRALWKGKVFYRNDRLLRNRIEDLALLKPIIEGDLEHDPEDHASTARTSGCSSRRSSTAGRACSTAGASRSSSTTSSPTRSRATARSPTSSPAATGSRCATRSAWCAPASISAAPTPARCSS